MTCRSLWGKQGGNLASHCLVEMSPKLARSRPYELKKLPSSESVATLLALHVQIMWCAVKSSPFKLSDLRLRRKRQGPRVLRKSILTWKMRWWKLLPKAHMCFCLLECVVDLSWQNINKQIKLMSQVCSCRASWTGHTTDGSPQSSETDAGSSYNEGFLKDAARASG